MEMDRRLFLSGIAALSLTGCAKAAEGTEEIHYGRETCTKCGMVISDPHFAAEIRGGPDRQLVKFDDAGCAVNWLETQAWRAESTTDFWVMDADTGQSWLKAKEAWYMPGAMSPMNYGFSAHPQKQAEMVDFAAMTSAALAKG
jgi:copper chaperone NosL